MAFSQSFRNSVKLKVPKQVYNLIVVISFYKMLLGLKMLNYFFKR